MNNIPLNQQIRFTSDDLMSAIEMFLEYRYVHGFEEDKSKYSAVSEIEEGVEAGFKLVAEGELPPDIEFLQVQALRQVSIAALKVGDSVRLNNDWLMSGVTTLLTDYKTGAKRSHRWPSIGDIVRVTHIHADGDIHVEYEGERWPVSLGEYEPVTVSIALESDVANLLLAAQNALDAINRWGLKIPHYTQIGNKVDNEAEVAYALQAALKPFATAAKSLRLQAKLSRPSNGLHRIPSV